MPTGTGLHDRAQRPFRLVIAALIALTLGAGYYRYQFERRKAEAAA